MNAIQTYENRFLNSLTVYAVGPMISKCFLSLCTCACGDIVPLSQIFFSIQKDSGTAEVRPSWIRKLQQKQEGGKNQKGTEAKQENKEKGKQEVKRKPQGNTTKKKPAPGKDSGVKKQSNAKAGVEEKERVGEERAVDGKGCL